MILPANDSGAVKWQSPSNIALVKYWGKRPIQIPQNPSISFTLSNAFTQTSIDYRYDHMLKDGPKIDFYFEGKEKPAFAKRIIRFIESLKDTFTWLSHCHLHIDSTNSFPHSSGIASSASAMSALALGLCDIAQQIEGKVWEETVFLQKASNIARLGSGSASRSVYPDLAIWGTHHSFQGSSDNYAMQYSHDIHERFLDFHDDILIISPKEKSVSSTIGHQLMENNPYAATRYDQAHKNLEEIVQAMKANDMDSFGRIVEEEAMTLHALMMASKPGYMLMQPNTIAAINTIRAYREKTGTPVYFTLDAGPNIHLLYPNDVAKNVHAFRESSLKPLCYNHTIIEDHVGKGPKKLV